MVFVEGTDAMAAGTISMMIFYSSMSYDYLEEYLPYTLKDVLGKNLLTPTVKVSLCIGITWR